MCTHDQRAMFAATHTSPKPEDCEELHHEMDDASTKTALIILTGIVVLAPILGFAIGGALFGFVWTAFSFIYLCFIAIPFTIASQHDAREDARKEHLA